MGNLSRLISFPQQTTAGQVQPVGGCTGRMCMQRHTGNAAHTHVFTGAVWVACLCWNAAHASSLEADFEHYGCQSLQCALGLFISGTDPQPSARCTACLTGRQGPKPSSCSYTAVATDSRILTGVTCSSIRQHAWAIAVNDTAHLMADIKCQVTGNRQSLTHMCQSLTSACQG